jgi:hypothetical protein
VVEIDGVDGGDRVDGVHGRPVVEWVQCTCWLLFELGALHAGRALCLSDHRGLVGPASCPYLSTNTGLHQYPLPHYPYQELSY